MAFSKIIAESMDLTDTYAFTGTVTGAGESNSPIFYGELSSSKTLSRATTTKIDSMTGNEVDSDTAFDGTTFTVPSGKAGTYYIEGVVTGDSVTAGQDGEEIRALIYKNGSEIKNARLYKNTAGGSSAADVRTQSVVINVILALSVGDTIELYGRMQDQNASGNMDARSGETSLGGYRIKS